MCEKVSSKKSSVPTWMMARTSLTPVTLAAGMENQTTTAITASGSQEKTCGNQRRDSMTQKEAAEILQEEISYQKYFLGNIKNPVIESLEMAATALKETDDEKKTERNDMG